MASPPAINAAPAQPGTISYWGMNLYMTKRERLGRDNFSVLADTAIQGGVQWTREELPWDLIEPANGRFALDHYDAYLRRAADKGLGIIGILLTTPSWARDGACSGTYWCPPANVDEYAQFAAYMAERYDGDGLNDAPGSPRIAAWEIWNEPNDTALWPNIDASGNARKKRYGQMLVAAFEAITNADPTAKVLIGGVYIYDGSNCQNPCDGLVFLDGVFQQAPDARQAFHVMAIHPYIPTERPDAPNIPRLITVEGRIRTTRARLDNAYGRADAPIWITEIGWCTATGACPGGVQVAEDQQANYLTRSMVIAQQNGVEHTSWFQFDDAFDDPNRIWGNAAIVHNYNDRDYPPKPAYYAYRTLVQQLSGATVAGTGPAHTHVYDPSNPYVGDNGLYDYRYRRAATTIDVLWIPTGSQQVSFPVDPNKQVTRVDRDGAQERLTPSGGAVQVTVTERPIFIVQGDFTQPPSLQVSPGSLNFLAEVGASSTSAGLFIGNAGSGTLAWSAITSTPWLILSSTSGVAPASLWVTANTSGMGVGTYSGTIRVTGTNNAGTVDVPVRLTIAPVLYRTNLPLVRR